jgi:hypothetical protein
MAEPHRLQKRPGGFRFMALDEKAVDTVQWKTTVF